MLVPPFFFFFFFNDTATTEIYTLSLHDALPICARAARRGGSGARLDGRLPGRDGRGSAAARRAGPGAPSRAGAQRHGGGAPRLPSRLSRGAGGGGIGRRGPRAR